MFNSRDEKLELDEEFYEHNIDRKITIGKINEEDEIHIDLLRNELQHVGLKFICDENGKSMVVSKTKKLGIKK